MLPVGFNTHKQIICDSVDVNAATHCQVDNDYLAVKNTDGVLKVWSKKTGNLVNISSPFSFMCQLYIFKLQYYFFNYMVLLKELNCSPEPLDTYGTSAVGNKLALCSGLDGVINVWDLETSKVIIKCNPLFAGNSIPLLFS